MKKYTLLSLALIAPLSAGNGPSRLADSKGAPPVYEAGASSANARVQLGSYRDFFREYRDNELDMTNAGEKLRGIIAVYNSMRYGYNWKGEPTTRVRSIKHLDRFLKNLPTMPEVWVEQIIADLQKRSVDKKICVENLLAQQDVIAACGRFSDSPQLRLFKAAIQAELDEELAQQRAREAARRAEEARQAAIKRAAIDKKRAAAGAWEARLKQAEQ